MSSPIITAIEQICEEKGISLESVVETIEAALAAAYRKDFGKKNQNIKVKFNPETGETQVYDHKIVMEKPEEEPLEEAVEEEESKEKEEIKTVEEEPEKKEEVIRFNPKLHLTLEEAKLIKPDANIGEEIITKLEVPSAYGRMAAQTAKQVIIQKLREAERDNLFKEFKKREGEIVTGIIQRREGRIVLVDLGKATAVMPLEEQLEREHYQPGNRLKFYIISVNVTPKGPEIIASRAHTELVRQLFTLEIPEISAGTVQIKAVSREAGSRSKIAVIALEENIDPIGACVGQRGSRVQTIINELGGEKIDIIEYNENLVKFIANALSPAKIISVEIDENKKEALAVVPNDQLSLAIGKAGQNVRLAAKLTGWKINIKAEAGEIISGEEAKKEEAEKTAKEEKTKPEETKEKEKEKSNEEK